MICKNDIFTADPFCRFANQVELDRGRYLEPSLSGYHACCHIGTADTCGKCAKCAVCTGMGIRTDDCVSCYSQTFFRKERMLDSHLSHVKIVGDIMTTGKFTDSICSFLQT